MTRPSVILTLTPLLDLMLVVIFAQYIDLQEAAKARVREEQFRRADAERAEKQKDEAAKSAFEALRRQNDILRQLRLDNERIAQDNESLRKRLEEKDSDYRQQLERERREAAESVRQIARTFQDVLNVPQAVMAKTLGDVSPNEAKRLFSEIAKLRKESIPEIVRHLHEVAEFRKRWDIWDVHIRGDGSCRLRVNGTTVKDKLFAASKEAFFSQLEQAVKEIDEPKSFVLVIVSYADATRRDRENIMSALAMAREKFRNYWSREKQIYVSRLGYIAEAP